MPASIGVNLRVTGHCRQGGRKYMEDFFSVAYQQTEDEKDLEYAFFGIYDGHGGAEAAAFAKEHLMETIIKHKNFWSDDDEDVLRAIKDGYIATHYAMWREQEKWPKTASGLPSTAGTTASIAFIRRGKIYIGHVGDSGIILGYQEPGSSEWKAKPLTRDHKPENADEMSRIEQCGGKVVAKSGVPRVVWNRPRIGHQGPVRRSTPIDEIPFLAVARSLGDLWSYNSQIDRFVVSPQPDCLVLEINTDIHRCLIFGTDGLYNMLSPGLAVHIVQQAERHNETAALSDSTYKTGWLNPSKLLVEKALDRWHSTKMRADNTSAVTLMLDPPGPPRAQVLKDRKKNLPEKGLKIVTRYDNDPGQEPVPTDAPVNNNNNCDNVLNADDASVQDHLTPVTVIETESEPAAPVAPVILQQCLNEPLSTECAPVSSSDLSSLLNSNQPTCSPLKERNHHSKPRESLSFDPRLVGPETPSPQVQCNPSPDVGKENVGAIAPSPASPVVNDSIIQCNEVSSSNIEVDGEEHNNTAKNSVKRNLRSSASTSPQMIQTKMTRSSKSDGDIITKCPKRKLESQVGANSPRKSLRIDNHHKKSEVSSQNAKKPPEASENSTIDLRRSKNVAQMAPKIAQKILKCKNVNMKKKDVIKKPVISKKKIRLILDRVKNVQRPKLVKVTKEKLPKVKNKAEKPAKMQKVVVTKVAFMRQSKQTASQRQSKKVNNKSSQKFLTKPTKQLIGNNKDKNEKNAKEKSNAKVETVEKKVAIKKAESSVVSVGVVKKSRVSITSPPKKEVPTSSSAKKSLTKNKPKSKEPVKTITLKKRLQQKTESLRRNVMRKK